MIASLWLLNCILWDFWKRFVSVSLISCCYCSSWKPACLLELSFFSCQSLLAEGQYSNLSPPDQSPSKSQWKTVVLGDLAEVSCWCAWACWAEHSHQLCGKSESPEHLRQWDLWLNSFSQLFEHICGIRGPCPVLRAQEWMAPWKPLCCEVWVAVGLARMGFSPADWRGL